MVGAPMKKKLEFDACVSCVCVIRVTIMWPLAFVGFMQRLFFGVKGAMWCVLSLRRLCRFVNSNSTS